MIDHAVGLVIIKIRPVRQCVLYTAILKPS